MTLCHFTGGPWDGETRELHNPPLHLAMPYTTAADREVRPLSDEITVEAIPYYTAVYSRQRWSDGRIVYTYQPDNSTPARLT